MKAIPTFKLSPPWTTFRHKVEALFAHDPGVRVDVSGENTATPEIKLHVEKPAKAAALARLLPTCRAFGGVTVQIAVVPANEAFALPKASRGVVELAHAAFEGNGAVAAIRQMSGGAFRDLVYVAFKPEVVQFFNDDLGDINGNWSGLYAGIAKEVCDDAALVDGILFCTAAKDELLGQEVWP